MRVFISGGTGYMGARLIPALLARGHQVRALARGGSERKLPPGCEPIRGNALDAATFAERLPPADVLVHLTGVAHPAPWKARQFREVDLTALRASLAAMEATGLRHLVFVSVARPAPVMKAFQEVRARCEELIEAGGVNANILRPWYVLGPGHRWPHVLAPAYRLLEAIPATRASAARLGLVSIDEMTGALVWAVENAPTGTRILDVPAIRSFAARTASKPAAGVAT